MSNEENAGEILEVASPSEVESNPKESEAAAPAPVQETEQERDFKSLREAKKNLERELEAQRREIDKLRRSYMDTPQHPQPTKTDEFEGYVDDDFVSVAQLKKLKSELKQMFNEYQGSALEDRVRLRNRDYDEVVTQENLEKLFQDVPELRGTLTKMYEMAMQGADVDPISLSYKLIKKFQGNSMDKKPSADVEKIAKNLAKPISSNAIKSQALTEAHTFGRLSKDDAARLYKETVEASKARR